MKDQYLILSSNYPAKLAEEVSEHISNGYSPCGSMSAVVLNGLSKMFYQPVRLDNSVDAVRVWISGRD